jgi:hypothetical protein
MDYQILFVFQYNLIARIDHSCQLLVLNLSSTPDFDFILHSKLNWSKNVDKQGDASKEIVLGAMNYHIEIFLGSAGREA